MTPAYPFRAQRLAQAIALASLMSPALAALPPVAPDAGRLTRELQQPVEAPRPGVSVTVPSVSKDQVAPGGLKVQITALNFVGNSIYSDTQLRQLLANAIGQSYDLAGLYAVADALSTFYREQGYAFAKVFVPADGFANGVLTLQVVEGRYGQLNAQADSPKRSAQAQRFLAPLAVGSVIYAPDLERQTLLLNDQPGYTAMPIMSPGNAVGTGDLSVKLSPSRRVTGSISASNHGNRYTGYYLARAQVQVNSPLMFGDQFTVSQLISDERLQASAVSYNLPIGGSGLRATAGYSNTSYRLAREFANLQASGRAQTTSLGMSYPFMRTRSANLTASAQAQHKRFYDEQRAVGAQQSRRSDSAVLGLNFDRSDRTGVTYGQVEWALGNFDGPVPDTAQTNGRFARLTADIVRLQRLNDVLSTSLRVNGQLASQNLDSSESFTVGGPFGVRAYPTGEGTGDQGLVAQWELRYQAKAGVVPYVFFDAGRSSVERKATAPGKNSRSLSGAGVGLRYGHGPFSVDTLLARRLVGGDPQSDPRDGSLMAWLILNYAF